MQLSNQCQREVLNKQMCHPVLFSQAAGGVQAREQEHLRHVQPHPGPPAQEDNLHGVGFVVLKGTG